jgi:alkanesulfonate monooxygenase SsuD/methylene tetrahydromethanopterin reductase-like flavin-dependent oxidoreductase (luciferase family)
MGYSIMAIPMAAEKLRETLFAYRDAYRAAGHPGNGEVMLALHMFVDEDGERARRIARPQIDAYFRSLLEAANDWTTGTSSSDYKDYDKKYERLSQQTMESLIASGSALIGTPAEARASLIALNERIGGFEHASLQVNFHLLPQAEALRSLDLFGREVIPALGRLGVNPSGAAFAGTPTA